MVQSSTKATDFLTSGTATIPRHLSPPPHLLSVSQSVSQNAWKLTTSDFIIPPRAYPYSSDPGNGQTLGVLFFSMWSPASPLSQPCAWANWVICTVFQMHHRLKTTLAHSHPTLSDWHALPVFFSQIPANSSESRTNTIASICVGGTTTYEHIFGSTKPCL